MPITLTARGGADFRANVQALDADQARQALQAIQQRLSRTGKDSGTLTLFNRTKGDAQLTLERKRGFQLLGRGQRLKDTKDVLVGLLDRAGLPGAKDKLLAQLGTSNRVDARTMLAILNAHLVAPGARDGAAAPGNGPEIPAQPGASQPAEPRAQPAAPDHAAVRGSTLEALLANAGVNRGAVLGRGYFGEVCRATIAGEPLVLKTYHPHAKEKQILSNERGGKPDEAIAAYLTSKTRHKDHQVNVVQPRFFLVKPLGGNEHRMVDPLELRALLKEGKRQKITWECVGLLMPEAKGGELRGLLQQGTLTEQNKRQVLKGTLEAVMKLNARGFIHRDLKPTNLFFDPASGKTTLIDTGLMHKTSKNRPETLFLKSGAGTPTYKHPRVGRADHGTETDLYATAMMALELAHGKKGRELASELSFRADATGGAEALSESLKRILHKTDNKGQLLQDPAGNLIPTEDFKAIQLSMQDKTSLASLALACLEQADKPAKEWAHTANAQWIYADLLRHPSLQES